MSTLSHHVIRQQHLHVELSGTESEGLALQNSLAELCQDWLTPALERVLERCSPPEGHLFIERLDIDAGTLMLENFEHELIERVAQAVEKALREHTLKSQTSQAGSSAPLRHKTAQHTLAEAFIYFLKNASLPWSFHLPKGRTLEQLLRESWASPTESGWPTRTVRESVLPLLASKSIRKRLILQFSPGFLKTLLTFLAPEGPKAMAEALEGLHSATPSPAAAKDFERHLWQTAFALLSAGRALTSQDLVREAWIAPPQSAEENGALASGFERRWPGITRDAPVAVHRDNRTSKRPPHRSAVEDQPSLPGAAPDTPEVSADIHHRTGEHPDIGEGIYVNQAGLVLLHPFLPRFFTAIGVACDDKIVQPERALCVLHYLTTGQAIAPEHELVLPKILCNVSLETPVASDVALTTTEQAEAATLLKAVIRHWGALRNTSPDALRGTFLLRQGKVSRRSDGDWFLQVESKTCDILLEQLPWGVSMIKLPWMDTMLWVEWR